MFVIVAHIVLVPAFLAGGVALAVVRGREHARLLQVEGACPRCAAALSLTPGGAARSGRTLVCPECRHELTLSFLDDRDAAAGAPPVMPA